MATPFLGEIRIFAFNYAPKNWAQCNGQLMSIAQNQALFSLLGTTYGGNGQTTFALPDLRGRAPFHWGNGAGSNFVLGQQGGEETHALVTSEMPTHTHAVSANASSDNQGNPQNNYWANSGRNHFAGSSNAAMATAAASTAGGSQPHANLSPYLVVNICMALTGIFPSRN
jgi:microcystin-dependent protein